MVHAVILHTPLEKQTKNPTITYSRNISVGRTDFYPPKGVTKYWTIYINTESDNAEYEAGILVLDGSKTLSITTALRSQASYTCPSIQHVEAPFFVLGMAVGRRINEDHGFPQPYPFCGTLCKDCTGSTIFQTHPLGMKGCTSFGVVMVDSVKLTESRITWELGL